MCVGRCKRGRFRSSKAPKMHPGRSGGPGNAFCGASRDPLLWPSGSAAHGRRWKEFQILLLEEVCAAKHDARGTSGQDLHLVMKVPAVVRVEMMGDFVDVDRQASLAQRISP